MDFWISIFFDKKNILVFLGTFLIQSVSMIPWLLNWILFWIESPEFILNNQYWVESFFDKIQTLLNGPSPLKVKTNPSLPYVCMLVCCSSSICSVCLLALPTLQFAKTAICKRREFSPHASNRVFWLQLLVNSPPAYYLSFQHTGWFLDVLASLDFKLSVTQ